MNVEEALELIACLLKQEEKLNHRQELIFYQSWENNTYREIADNSGYTEEYIRDNGAKLWQLLSAVLDKKVTKQNFKFVLERYSRQQQHCLVNSSSDQKSLNYHVDWEEAIDVSSFCGRSKELTMLQKMITEDKCRLLGIFGIGGIGKTSLTVKLAQQLASQFDFLVWRSLRNAPQIDELLAGIIQFLSQQQEIKQNLPGDTGGKISKLIAYLRSHRCLLILDNGETILQSGISCGRYREGYDGYRELFKRIGEIPHQSCLILTSREKSQEFITLEGDSLPVRSFLVRGLETDICQSICQLKGHFDGSPENWQTLTYNYSGNPLALKIVAATIKDLFDGNIEQFLQQNILSFDDIEDLLTEQFNRLSQLEQEIMYWLAIEREPIDLVQLQKDLLLSFSSKKILEAVKSLRRRSLIEQTAGGFTQQPVVMEYLIERQITKVAAEIETQTPKLLTTHALIKAETKDYVRETQKRLTLQPLIDILLENHRDKTQIISKLRQIIAKLQRMPQIEVGYTVGNIINLLQQLEIDLTNFDFSHTSIRQAYLNNLELHQVQINDSELIDSVFSESLDNVFALSFNSQGNILASGHLNGDIYLWSIPNGEKLLSWSAYSSGFESLVFSPDNRILASANCYEDIKLWDYHTGKLLKTLPQKVAPYSNLVFLDKDDEILIFANSKNQVCLWNINTGEYLATLTVETTQILTIDINLDGNLLACGCADGILQVWDLQTYKTIKTSQLQTSIYALAFAPDGYNLFLSCMDLSIKQWEIKTERCLKELRGHTSLFLRMDLNHNARLLATGSTDDTIRLWQIDTGECLNVLQGHKNDIWSVAFSSNGRFLASGSLDNSIKLWSIPSGNLIKTLQGYQSSIWALAFSPDGRQLVSGFDDCSVRLWDINTGNSLKTFQKHDTEIHSLAWHPGGQILASGDCYGIIKIWNLDSGRCLHTLSDHIDWVNSLAFSADGQFLASGSRDQRIHIWNPLTGENFRTIVEDDDVALIWSVAFHPYNSSILASGGYSCAVKLWNINTGELIETFRGHQSFIDTVIFSPDASTIASGSYDRTIKLWDTKTGKCIKTLQGHTNRVIRLAFSPDGSMIASGSFDCTIKIWEVNTGKCIKIITEQNIIMSLCFNPEGTMLAIGCRSGEIKFWHLETEEYQQTFRLPRIYEQMNITGVTGLTETQKTTLKILGAVEDRD